MTSPRLLRRAVAASGALVVVTLGLSLPGSADAVPLTQAAAAERPAYQKTKTLERVFAEADGSRQVVASNTVTVAVDQTQNLRGRQRVRVSWTGAAPSAGRAINPYGVRGMQQEYPVVILQCRGRDETTLPLAQRVRPETCFTSSFSQRSAVQKSPAESTWTRDLYANPADREPRSGIEPFPDIETCPEANIGDDQTANHLTEFVARSTTVFPACSADTMPPEAAVDGAFPAAEIAAFTDQDGNGSAQFEVRSDIENESLGCSYQVACSIVVIPIMGLSCDAPREGDQTTDQACRKFGSFAPGSSNFTGLAADQAVSPALWWSSSNWRNRFSVPITFGTPPSVCDVLDPRSPVGFYGSELLAQAALQWSPAYCLNRDRFKFQLNLTSDIAGFNLMQVGQTPAAVVSSSHEATTTDPIGYAPTAVTGFGIGYVIDRPDNAGEFTALRLTPRLVAKLLTESYLGSDLGRGHPGMEGNPLGLMNDPEFQQLNRGLSRTSQEAGATLLSLSDSSDVIEQLTEWIAADDRATAFVNGEPDEYGMVVNPHYRGVDLPRPEIPLLDDYVPETKDVCRQANPQVYLNQVASPVSRLRQIAEAVLDGWPYVQTRCERDPATGRDKLGRVDQQSYGSRFMLGLVSLGDAERYGLRTAALQTETGRFVGPTTTGLSAAVAQMRQQGGPLGPYVLDQDDVVRDGRAYPGTMAVYTAARTRNLDQDVADDVAQFIRVSTTEGQRPGSGNGQLPGGYLPIRETGVTGDLFTTAQRVADAVEAQRPAPTQPSDGPITDSPTTDSPTTNSPTDEASTDAPVTTPTSSSGGDPALPDPTTDVDDVPPPGGDGAPTDAATPTVAPVVDQPVETQSASPTDASRSGLMGKLFPVLVIVAVLAGGWLAGTRFFVRPPRSLT